MRTKAKATYLEESRGTYLFNKRLNRSKGTFPLWDDKIKRKIGSTASMSKAEALTTAARISADLEHLQTVCLRDAKGLDNSVKDQNKASQTWLWLAAVDLVNLKEQSARKTKEGREAEEALTFLLDEVISHFRQSKARPDHPDGALDYLTPFGDHLLTALKTGARSATFSEALTPYLKHTHRDHLPETDS